LGKFSDDLSLTIALSAADLFISPSLQENLSNSIMESLACGTPVVAFNTGGNSDLIIHRKNGYLANKFEIEDFSKGIVEILYNSEYEVISNFSKKNVIDNFSEEVVIPKYIQYYNSLL
jgi:glycosyltransferase involved in cell wall biosynthesis